MKVLVNNPVVDCNIGNHLSFTLERNLPNILCVLLTNPVADALIIACRCNYLQCVKQFVLDKRCSPEILNRKNKYEKTALITAVAYAEIVELSDNLQEQISHWKTRLGRL